MSNKAIATDTSAYVSIMKMEDQEDGTLLVYGKATDDTLDSDEQVCDPAWLERAMPEWFKFGNIREQHSSIAAGVATEYKNQGSEHFITAHVVDPNSVKKVKTGVLKGFSIGIRRPRVVKDNKAIGGRIVDGQIVEISLVDRPANPACTLMVAKTIGADLVQVEEYTQKEITAEAVIEMAKEFAADTVKFDQAAFDAARRALATLIMVEANEMGEGHDERHSLACLLAATHALMEWHEGEAHEGEVAPMIEMEEDMDMEMEMAIEPEDVKEDNPFAEDDEDEEKSMCKECHKSMKECKCDGMKADEPDTAVKCLECGCHQPADDHGRDDVTTAVVVESEEKSDTPEVSDIKTMVEDIVKSLLTNPTVGEEVATKAADSERIEALESELAQVKSLAAPSGPKRFAAVSNTTPDVKKSKAALYRAKAANTLDKSLANGYLALAIDLEKSDS
jgi:hypothetical protein